MTVVPWPFGYLYARLAAARTLQHLVTQAGAIFQERLLPKTRVGKQFLFFFCGYFLNPKEKREKIHDCRGNPFIFCNHIIDVCILPCHPSPSSHLMTTSQAEAKYSSNSRRWANLGFRLQNLGYHRTIVDDVLFCSRFTCQSILKTNEHFATSTTVFADVFPRFGPLS